ncbi:hypothetical protein [Cryptosporangium sp. NPDC051539]|uniref:hypothetical protein n=1 Tax=Cryptosporangium sp. NPDC051539 TaxID=3363962 RepID=UPI0037A63B6C
MSTPARLFAVYCPVHDWLRTDPATEHAATQIAGTHDDTLHRGELTTLLAVVEITPLWRRCMVADPARTGALLRRTVITAVTGGAA